MAVDDPGRQPFARHGSAEVNGPNDALANIGPVPAGKRWVVESVSVIAITPSSSSVYTLQLNGLFTLYLQPVLVSGGAFGLNKYVANSTGRFYVEAGQSVQFQFGVTSGNATAECYLSGYLLNL